MTRLAFELDDAAEAEFYNIVDYYKRFDRSLSSDLYKNLTELFSACQTFPQPALPIYMVQSVLFSGVSHMLSFIKSIGMK